MDRGTAIDILRANETALRRLGLRHADLFGSIARGESHAGSDLDVMNEAHVKPAAERDAVHAF